MPCYVCNPTCGQCKGIRKRSINCPDCGLIVFPELLSKGDGRCPHCGTNLMGRAVIEDQTRHCNFTGNDCPHPCSRSYYEFDGEYHPCPLAKQAYA